ncbi:hypothetical protein D3C87_1587830 [compost metagenome]
MATPIARAIRSVPPPGENGTTMRTGLSGKVLAACAAPGAKDVKGTHAAAIRARETERMLGSAKAVSCSV